MQQGISTNIATYVGSSQIWTYVHGEKAGPVTPAETRQMRELVRTPWSRARWAWPVR